MTELPLEFRNQIEEMLGEEAPAFFCAMDAAPTLALRVNPLKPAAREAAAEFCADAVPWAAHGYYLKPGLRPGISIAHSAGAFYLQEASAMVSAAVLDAQPGEKILDLCAAPGGKSTQLAGALAGRGLLVANEPDSSRARILASNLERFGATNALVVNQYPQQLAQRWPDYFDAILVDAPCSGEGMFRRDPDARLQWNAAAPAGCAKRQAEILDAAAQMLRPGGRLIYSTCTFNTLENEGSILAFLNRHADFSPEDFSLPGLGGSSSGMLRIWPQRVRGDGHFAARLRKADGAAHAPDSIVPPSDRDLPALLKTLRSSVLRFPEWLETAKLMRYADRVYALSPLCPPLKGIRVVSPGVCLFRIGRNYIEPEHALAMALTPGFALREAALSHDLILRYLTGEALPFSGEPGWTLVVHNDLPLGWAKLANETLKNHLPKGLRTGAGQHPALL